MHGYTHAKIKDTLSALRGNVYWCMCDEMGDECETYHTHLFIYRNGPITAERIRNLFPNVHMDKCYGTCDDNQKYIAKSGDKYTRNGEHYHYVDKTNKVHDGINYSDTFESHGELPVEHQGKSNTAETILQLVADGLSNYDIVRACPSAYTRVSDIERFRQLMIEQQYQDTARMLSITYQFGAPGTGKTRYVMEKYGYRNVYRITDYDHPFDGYKGQNVILFEEFRSQIKLSELLSYIDIYPVELKCRYTNKIACYNTVYFNTNITLENQYRGVDDYSRKAFYRRINTVRMFYDGGVVEKDMQHYLSEGMKFNYTDYDLPPAQQTLEDLPF